MKKWSGVKGAKQRWLKEGDRNTKYFHQCTSHKKQVNSIRSIANEEGLSVNNQERIAQAFQDYYMNLFSTSVVGGTFDLLQSFQPWVTT